MYCILVRYLFLDSAFHFINRSTKTVRWWGSLLPLVPSWYLAPNHEAISKFISVFMMAMFVEYSNGLVWRCDPGRMGG